MLNKIIVTGKFLSSNNPDFFNEQKEKLINYFSILVPTPSRSLTILRCLAQNEIVEKINKEIKTNDIVTIKGYLKNEKEGRQILIKVINIKKLETVENIEDLDYNISNKARLIGKIITDFNFKNFSDGQGHGAINQFNSNDSIGNGIVPFKLLVPQHGSDYDMFFCRINNREEIIQNKNLSKGMIIMVEGFLQTKKVVKKFFKESNDRDNEQKNIERISSFICQRIIILDTYNQDKEFLKPLDNLSAIEVAVDIIDFSKPK